MNNIDYNIYEFPECKSIIISGDIHGDFNLLVNKMCMQYKMENTLLIVAGDCGFGFENRGYYENIVKKNTKRMNEANNWIFSSEVITTILPISTVVRSSIKGLLPFQTIPS